MSGNEHRDLFIIPLKFDKTPDWKRAKRSVRFIKVYISHYLKHSIKDIKISKPLNYELWKRGSKKPPYKIKIKIVKTLENIIWVYNYTK